MAWIKESQKPNAGSVTVKNYFLVGPTCHSVMQHSASHVPIQSDALFFKHEPFLHAE